jgi:hypothetical protein
MFLVFLIPILGISQNYKLVDSEYPEIVMKKIENDTISARLITSNNILEGFVVYRQIKRLDINKVYRYPESFLDNEDKPIKDVLYYQSNKIGDTTSNIWLENSYTTPMVMDAITIEN